jgi:methylaspartate mutase sigma subunit
MENSLNVMLTGTPSDSHTWNLIFMELFLQENGCKVFNLGACVPIHKIHQSIEKLSPDLVVISSINGHLFQDSMEIMSSLSKSSLKALPPLVVGGKMGISLQASAFQKKKLIKLGYNEVFTEKSALLHFKKYLYNLRNINAQRTFKRAV